MATYILACVLLMGDGEPPKQPSLALLGAIKHVALSMEVMDARSASWFLNDPKDFIQDLATVRGCCRKLRGAPPLSDVARLPSREALDEMLRLNCSVRLSMKLSQGLELQWWWQWQECIQECDRLYQIWDAALDSQRESFYVMNRRNSLKRFRDLVGHEAYHTGPSAWPPPIPLWACRVAE